jgi:signal peptidase II
VPRLQAPRGAGSLDRSHVAFAATAVAIVAADQLTKQMALDRLGDHPVDVIPGVLTLRLTFNSGGVFGIGRGLPWLFLAATIVIVAVVVVAARRTTNARMLVPLGLVVGGGIGNTIDRVVRDLGGRVVDFIDFHVWPVFNVADMAIVAGAALLLLTSRQSKDEDESDED